MGTEIGTARLAMVSTTLKTETLKFSGLARSRSPRATSASTCSTDRRSERTWDTTTDSSETWVTAIS